jgi:signal transduction histidine kinase
LSQLTQSTVRVGNPTANVDDQISSSGVSFGEHLQDWNGQPVGTILVSSKVQIISDLNNTYDSELRVLAIFSLAIILLIAFASWRFVIRPINLITNSIAIKRPDLLGDLSTSKTEFGSLAATVQAFFQQKTVIAESEIHKQELESQSKQTSAFLTTTVQELRGPIESIHQSTNLIATKVMMQAPAAEIRHLLDNIAAQLSRTDVLMHDLQSASEGKAALRFQLQDIDFGAFLDREIERLRPSTAQQIVVTNQTHLFVRGDVDRLGQVLTNLLHTATQRAPEKSTIEVIAQSQDNQVLMTIHDSGPAISAEQQQHIFDEPKQTSTSPADTSGDMPMSKRIIDQMGGRIWVMSDPEKGNFIHLAIPGITVNSSPETFTAAVQ